MFYQQQVDKFCLGILSRCSCQYFRPSVLPLSRSSAVVRRESRQRPGRSELFWLLEAPSPLFSHQLAQAEWSPRSPGDQYLSQRFSARGRLAPSPTPTPTSLPETFSSVWRHFWFSQLGGMGVLLTSSGQRPEVLLNSLHWPGGAPTTRNDPVQMSAGQRGSAGCITF